MKSSISYAKSAAPKFDAVEDIKEYLGERYETLAPQMKCVTDREQFAILCGFAGIEGFPVIAWYDHFHGENSYLNP